MVMVVARESREVCGVCESKSWVVAKRGVEGATHALSTNAAHTNALNLQKLLNLQSFVRERMRLDISHIQG